MSREKVKAALWGILITAVLGGLIVAGSRNLAHFDAALVGYTFATLFAAFGITYRYAMWLQRPPTVLYWKRGWQVFANPRFLGHNLLALVRRFSLGFLINRFIWRRDRQRWLAHWLIMWGCVVAAAITFPLVFGWIHFETTPEDLDWYRTYVFGFPTFAFPIHSAFGFFVFHGLVWASILVIGGVMLAMRRRVRDHGAAAVQQFGEDFLALLHAVTVIFTLLWLPFGKFFHIFQRPAQLGVSFYKEVGARGEQARCRRCGAPFASRMHVEDLITVERQLGYHYELPGSEAEHYQWVCPRCRRAMLALAQGDLWNGTPADTFIQE